MDSIRCDGEENIKHSKDTSGSRDTITPYMIIQLGNDDEDGSEDLEEVYEMLKARLKVPFFVTTQKSDVYVNGVSI